MDKKLKWGIGIAGFLGVAFAVYKYYASQINKLFSYNWSINSVKFTTIGGGKLGLDINAKLTNPSEIGATISNMFVKIYLGNVMVGTVTDVAPFTINPKSSYDLPLHLDFTLSNLKGNFIDLARVLKDKKDLPLVFEGYSNVKYKMANVKIPFKYETTVKDYFFS